ncbi:S53 family peptidase [Nevskia soli]|uniref:S53 family peptidase n=1 Tax=Nevskia soli TaxID=418856 RepID=UPI000B299F1C|nr:S53 family peptidase [Nevskia soli]
MRLEKNKASKARATIGAAIALAALSLSATAQAAWHPTASHAQALENATQLGALPDTAPLRIAVSLKLQNQAALTSFLQSTHTLLSRDYGRTLTPEEFNAAYAPSARQVQAVTDYLTRAGFSNIVVAPNNLLVTAEAKRSLVETAFSTRIMQFKYADRVVYANTRDALVPDALDGLVLAITGLQNANTAHPLIQHLDASTKAKALPLAGTATGHVPVQFPAIYDAGSTPAGTATNIGIIAEGNLTQVLTDLRTYEAQNGLAQVPVTFVPSEVNGTDTSGLDEWDLDSQSSTSIAGGVQNLYFYNAASLNDSDLEVAYNRAVTDNKVKAVNVSLGICESSEKSSGAMAATDQIFQQAVALGITFFVSTGDGGAYTGCSSQEGIPTAVSYPASSPYVVAVGGTTVTTNTNGSYAGETTWAGGGGGVSVDETAPSWQQAITHSTARGLPDVSMDADPNSGAVIIVSGSSLQVGGTSLAAPLSTGTWARVESAHGNSLAFAAPIIYAAASTPGAFHDVTSGCNSGSGLQALLSALLGQKDYCAAAGYDNATGLGTFDIARFNAAVP